MARANGLEFGPVAVLSRQPPIFMTGIAFEEYLGIASAFGRTFGDTPAAFLIYPCWTIEDSFRAKRVISAANSHQDRFPTHVLAFLCNTGAERDILSVAGLDARLLNKNFVVSEQIFRPLPNWSLEFDAVYSARFVVEKRHELARDIAHVAYVTYDDSTDSEEARQVQRKIMADTLGRNTGHVLLNRMNGTGIVRLEPEGVNEALNRAAVGLCLSSVEGSSYASVEYLLAGLPVVSTPSQGGREVYFDHEFCTVCDPDPGAVAKAVESLKSRNIPRDYVRERTLAKIQPVRQSVLALVDSLRERLGGARHHYDGVWRYPEPTWKSYTQHLSEFSRASKTPAVTEEPSIT